MMVALCELLLQTGFMLETWKHTASLITITLLVATFILNCLLTGEANHSSSTLKGEWSNRVFSAASVGQRPPHQMHNWIVLQILEHIYVTGGCCSKGGGRMPIQHAQALKVSLSSFSCRLPTLQCSTYPSPSSLPFCVNFLLHLPLLVVKGRHNHNQLRKKSSV